MAGSYDREDSVASGGRSVAAAEWASKSVASQRAAMRRRRGPVRPSHVDRTGHADGVR